MGLFDTIIIPKSEIGYLGIIDQLDIVFDDPIVLQTKDIHCLLCNYTLRRCAETGVMYLSDIKCNSIFKIDRIIHAYNHFFTKDDREIYHIEYQIIIKWGIVESIRIENLFKLGNKQGDKGAWTIVANSVPLDKSI